MKTINRIQASVMIEQSKGRFFSVDFIKKNGEHRHMLARKGVKKHVSGKGSKYSPIEKMLSCVFDVKKDSYRMINLHTIKMLAMEGETFRVL